MEVKTFLDARFSVPPLVTLFLVFIFSPICFISLITKSGGGLLTLLVGPAVLFALGFLLSSLVTVLINILGIRASLSKESVSMLLKEFPFLGQFHNKNQGMKNITYY